MSTTPNMGLTAWDLNSDPYDHSQLAGNFTLIDEHDHQSGNGVQLGTGAFVNGAITTAKIADGAVTTIKIAAGAVTAAKLDQEFIHPIGECIFWWHPGSPVEADIPDGFVWPTGQTLGPGDHSFPGGGSVELPDFRNVFPLGAAFTGTGSGPTTPPTVGGEGGTHQANLSHSHSVNPHTHGVSGHTHTITAHSHTVAGHTHSISASGDHTHGINGDGAHNHGLMSRPNAFEIDVQVEDQNEGGALKTNTSQSTYVSGFAPVSDQSVNGIAAHNHGGATVAGGDHSHGGATGSATSTTSSDALTTNSTSLTTNADSGTTTAAGLSSTFDIRPQHVGLIILMKVKHV